MVLAAGPMLQTPPTATPTGGNGPMIQFRQATIERTDMYTGENGTFPTSTLRIERTVEGSGYIFGLLLEMDVLTAGNSANVAFFEDAPWSSLDTVVFRDVNGELVNLSGYNLYIANLANHIYRLSWMDTTLITPNTNLYKLITGSGATGGSFRFFLRVPVGTNRRDLVGILGNQDRAQKFNLRTDLAAGAAAASGPIYTTAPTAQGAYTMSKVGETYSVPLPIGPTGARQMSIPPTFGTIHFTTASQTDTPPQGGSTINHQLRRLGNTIRWMALVFRSNGTRASANSNAPTNIQLKIGDDLIFNETYDVRRAIMFERYGFELPAGVLLYEALHDFGAGADAEIGNDYLYTQSLTQAQFQITYPSGFGSTNNSLTIITDDLQMGTIPAMAR